MDPLHKVREGNSFPKSERKKVSSCRRETAKNRKCFYHVHVQKRGFTKFSVFLKRVSLLNPRVHTDFVAFPLEPGKSLEVRFDFGPRPGFSKQLSGTAGRAPNWTGRASNSSYRSADSSNHGL